jgi:hypothetical protein
MNEYNEIKKSDSPLIWGILILKKYLTDESLC